MTDNNFAPPVTPQMYKAVSQYRREQLEGEVQQGLFRDGSSRKSNNQLSPASYATVGGDGFSKFSQMAETGANAFRGGVGNTTFQNPEVYSPLWLTSNVNLPRDRVTMNAWCRSFYALNPIVQNAINLHSTYPISKLNIKCPNKKVERFFSEMIEEIDLMNICSQVAQEYWLLGEAIVYAELDERNAKWARLLIQNPDHIVIKPSIVASAPIIMMKPDENLRRICMGNLPSDIEQRKQLNETIINYVRRGQNIPLDNLYVSHLARRISPYEVRGAGLPLSIFRSLMLFDLIKECYDQETEVLTDQGFKKFNEVIDYTESLDGYIFSSPKKDIKIACFNSNTEELEYHYPINSIVKNYNGDMYHYLTNKIDLCVTPGHELWVSEKHRFTDENGKKVRKHRGWDKIQAKDLKLNSWKKFRTISNWVGEELNEVEIYSKKIPIELYLEFAGYFISEGNTYKEKNGSIRRINISQSNKKYNSKIAECVYLMAQTLGMPYHTEDRQGKNQKNNDYTTKWIFSNKKIYNHFVDNFGNEDGSTLSKDKKVPNWIKKLSPRLLKIFLNAACLGDGSFYKRKDPNHTGFRYYTTSKQLSDDIQEIVYKCGYAPRTVVEHRDEPNMPCYVTSWSSNNTGSFPNIYKYTIDPFTKEKKSSFTIETYDGKVWCLTVPTGLFITRRNGILTVQGNCKFSQASDLINPMRIIKLGGGAGDYRASPADLDAWREVWSTATSDKNFKIFTHDAVTVETIGAGQGIYDTSGDFAQLLKEMYAGLMIPQIVIEGGGDISYANGGISLDVLRQRYMQFRNMMSSWLRRKIFQPISKLNEFYDYTDGEKTLIIPEVDWNHMSLFDLESYVQTLKELTGEQKRVSVHTFYRSLGLEWEEERRKIRKEDIADAIREKEQASLKKMTLNELRTLTEEDEIPEILETPLPGESPYDDGGLPGMDSSSGSPPSAPPEIGSSPAP